MSIDFIFMVFWTAVADNMLAQCIVLTVIAKCIIAAYHKLILEDSKWFLALIPFSQYFHRWRLYYSSHIFVCILCMLFEVAFFFIHSIAFFVMFWGINCFLLWQEDEALGIGNRVAYMLLPGYKYVMMGKEVYANVRAEAGGDVRGSEYRAEPKREPELGTREESGTGES